MRAAVGGRVALPHTSGRPPGVVRAVRGLQTGGGAASRRYYAHIEWYSRVDGWPNFPCAGQQQETAFSSRMPAALHCSAAMALRREQARCGTHTSLPLAVGHYGVIPIGHQHLAHRGSVVVAIPALSRLSTLLPLWP